MRRILFRTVGAAATSLSLLTGCSTLHVGVGVRDPHAGTAGVNASLLDTGTFPTKPHAPYGKAGTTAVGSLIEARRMADMVVVPFEIDPELEQNLEGVKPFTKPSQLTESTSDFADRSMAQGIEDHNLIAGFATLAGSDSKSCRHVVMRFRTAQDATDAIADVATRAASKPSLPHDERHEQSITGYPDAQAYREFEPEKNNKFRYLYTYITHDVYLIADEIKADTLDEAVKLQQDLLDKQLPPLDGFQPTPVDDLPNLPRDPDGLLARTVPLPKTSELSALSGVYGRHGTLHFIRRAVGAAQLFDDADLSSTAIGTAMVFAARDSAGAASIATGLITQYAQDGTSYKKSYSADEPVKGIKDTHCLKPENKYKPFVCTGYYDRFAIKASSKVRIDTRRALAAQYAMLAAK